MITNAVSKLNIQPTPIAKFIQSDVQSLDSGIIETPVESDSERRVESDSEITYGISMKSEGNISDLRSQFFNTPNQMFR